MRTQGHAGIGELVTIDCAIERGGNWEFDVSDFEGRDVDDLTPEQYAAAVHVAENPEGADCENGADCVGLRPVAWLVDGVKYGPDYIGFHLVDDPDRGYEVWRFKEFCVTEDGRALCDGCGVEVE